MNPKGRIVILGHLDPEYEDRSAAIPNMTRNTRQFSAARRDVCGAFLQGRELQRDLWVP